jgi:ATP diphosphatase
MVMEKLLKIMAQLRDKKTGCPWDIEQDFASIAPHTVEEAYEVADAIERGDMAALKEELGDLLLQVVFHAQMASEKELFDFCAVVEGLTTKLVARHPHVFGAEDVKTAADQEVAWERLKDQERAAKRGDAPASLMDDITLGLPGLTRAIKLQKRAAKVGFDWTDPADILAKLDEEVLEVKEAMADKEHLKQEIGDLLFVCANLARRMDIDPEEAIRTTNRKFEQRFRFMEGQGAPLKGQSLEALEALWQRAKKDERV